MTTDTGVADPPETSQNTRNPSREALDRFLESDAGRAKDLGPLLLFLQGHIVTTAVQTGADLQLHPRQDLGLWYDILRDARSWGSSDTTEESHTDLRSATWGELWHFRAPVKADPFWNPLDPNEDPTACPNEYLITWPDPFWNPPDPDEDLPAWGATHSLWSQSDPIPLATGGSASPISILRRYFADYANVISATIRDFSLGDWHRRLLNLLVDLSELTRGKYRPIVGVSDIDGAFELEIRLSDKIELFCEVAQSGSFEAVLWGNARGAVSLNVVDPIQLLALLRDDKSITPV